MTPLSQGLELTWIDNENRPRLESRVLLEKPGVLVSRDPARYGSGPLRQPAGAQGAEGTAQRQSIFFVKWRLQ